MLNKKSKIFNYLYFKAHRGGNMWRWLFMYYTERILGCDIKPSTIIGEGFELYHSAHASVVSPGTIIGKNVSLRQNTTIGAKGFSGSEKSPVILDDVTIGPNVCIIGEITIGKGAIIGAGAVVVKDVPENAIVAGNPAKVIGMRK
jgi:serine acetyltransferase